MNSPESPQTNIPDNEQEVSPEQEQSPEEIDDQEENLSGVLPEYNRPPEDADFDILDDWLKEKLAEMMLREGITQTSDASNLEMIDLFIKGIAEKHPDEPELATRAAEIKKAVLNVPQIFNGLNESIKNIIGSENYSKEKVHEKIKSVIKAVILPVTRGHLTAEDMSNLIQSVQIVDDNKSNADGYNDVMAYQNGKIYIYKKSLVDNFKDGNNTLELDFNHMMHHEISHSLIEKTTLRDPEAIKIAKEILIAQENAPLHPQHVKLMVKNIENIDSDFANLKPEQKQRFSNVDSYRKFRESRAMVEILADYTAVYLKSNGDFHSFMSNVIEMATLNSESESEFLRSVGIDKAKLIEIKRELKNNGPDNISNGPLGQTVVLYKKIFDKISTSTKEAKGSIDSQDETEEEDLMSGTESYGSLGEEASSFGQGHKSGENKSILSEIGSFIAAMKDSAIEGK